MAEFSRYRHLEKIVQQVNEYMRSSNVYSKQTDKLDPKELDLLLGELTIMHSRAELYVRFIRRRVMVSHVIASSNSIIQGLINKRPDCCNKNFMLIDTTYSSLSPSK